MTKKEILLNALEKKLQKQALEALKNYRFYFIGISHNYKIGPMAAMYTATAAPEEEWDDAEKMDAYMHGSCPVARCLFCHKGCYGENFPCCRHWKNAAKKLGVDIDNLKEKIKNTPHLQTCRHNVAGDIAITGSVKINKYLLRMLTKIYKELGIIAYSYTHCEIDDEAAEELAKAAKNGFVVNASCERIPQAKKLIERGVPVVVAVETMKEDEMVIDGLKCKKCQFECNGTQCDKCRWCLNGKRDFAVVFEAHGNQKKKTKAFLQDI